MPCLRSRYTANLLIIGAAVLVGRDINSGTLPTNLQSLAAFAKVALGLFGPNLNNGTLPANLRSLAASAEGALGAVLCAVGRMRAALGWIWPEARPEALFYMGLACAGLACFLAVDCVALYLCVAVLRRCGCRRRVSLAHCLCKRAAAPHASPTKAPACSSPWRAAPTPLWQGFETASPFASQLSARWAPPPTSARNGPPTSGPKRRLRRVDSPTPQALAVSMQRGAAPERDDHAPKPEDLVLTVISTGSEEELHAVRGLGAKSVAKIMRYRQKGRSPLRSREDLVTKVGLKRAVVVNMA